MALVSGTRLGPYEVVSLIGSGGMGEVYQARDTRLDRTVAIKILPSAAPELKARFAREAKAVAALQHPHICTLFDVGHQDPSTGSGQAVDYLVLEYLEGQTLGQRLKRGRMKLQEVLKIAIEIASALDKAHRAGIVHRDLKPANVMLTKNGVKLLDFGLAKLKPPAIDVADASAAVTHTTPPITSHGTLLGTLHYMSPEQLEGKEPDHRADIWAFGCVLYEMLAARRPFEGQSHASLIAAVLTSVPRLPDGGVEAPPSLVRVVDRCLAKDPEERWQTAKDLESELQWIRDDRSTVAGGSTNGARRLYLAGAMVGLTALAILGLIAMSWTSRSQAARSAAPLGKFLIEPPENVEFREVAVAPDGRSVAIIGTTSDTLTHLWLRRLDDSNLELIEGADNPSSPFWSPDSKAVAFFSNGRLLKLTIGQHAPEMLTAVQAKRVDPRPGGAWSRNGAIVFSDDDGILRRVSDQGTSVNLRKPAAETKELWPAFLPDGSHLLWTVRSSKPDASGIFLGSLDSAVSHRISPETSRVFVVPPNRILYLQGSALQAQTLDVANARLIGDPVRIAEGVQDRTGYPLFAASADVLSYLGRPLMRLEWVDRQGNALGPITPPGEYANPALSPDGRRLAFEMHDHATFASTLWLTDFATGKTTQFTFPPSSASAPVWSPDGKRIAYHSNKSGPGIYSKSVDGLSGEEQLLKVEGGDARYAQPCDWSSDGRFILYEQMGRSFALPTFGDRKPLDIPVQGAGFPCGLAFAPDGHAVASASFGGLRMRDFPNGSVDTVVTGASGPPGPAFLAGGLKWRGDGKELFFVDVFEGAIKAVNLEHLPASSMTLFPLGGIRVTRVGTYRSASRTARGAGDFAVAKDGQRFIINRPLRDAGREPVTVVLNWAAKPES